MKRFLLIAGAAALLMTSCSEEKFLNEPGAQQGASDGDGAISFMATRPNQSRATTYGLENVTTNFGVFGVKADDRADALSDFDPMNHTTNPVLVFDNYLVGYYKTYPLNKDNGGTSETGGTPSTVFTSDWYYEGLGTSEYDYTGFDDALKSAHKNQYLKYWDGSKIHTYFVAYTPYENTAASIPTLKVGTLEDSFEPTKGFNNQDDIIFELDCPKTLEVNATEPFMVAARQELNSPHIVKGNTKPVSLKFNRFQPQIRIAFYEVIKGYKVQMIQEPDNASTMHGVTAMPYTVNGEGEYEEGTIPVKRKAKVLVVNPTETDADEDLTCLIRYQETDDPAENPDDNYKYLDFDIREVRLNGPLGDKTDYLWEERSNKAFSPTVYNVFPSYVTDAVGDMQFAISFKLIAEDTGEEIEVRNARVNIDAKYVTWEENCLYTYIFKITKDTNGTTSPKPSTSDPTLPEEPKTDPALYPIVFDQLTVANFTEEDAYEYTLYDSHNPTATDDNNGEFIFKSDADAKDFASVNVGKTLDLKEYMTAAYNTKTTGFTFISDNVAIATVDENGIVTGVAPGAVTIHVTYNDGTKIINDTIIIYVTINNSFLSNAKWNFGINEPVDLETIRNTGDTGTVAWYIYNPDKPEDDKFQNTSKTGVWTINGTKLTFSTAGTYFCKAVKNDATNTTDFFFVIVKENEFLKYNAQQSGNNGESIELNTWLKTGVDADRVTWYVDSQKLDASLPAGLGYTFNVSTKALTVTTDGTYLIKAEYANDPTVTEYVPLKIINPVFP